MRKTRRKRKVIGRVEFRLRAVACRSARRERVALLRRLVA